MACRISGDGLVTVSLRRSIAGAVCLLVLTSDSAAEVYMDASLSNLGQPQRYRDTAAAKTMTVTLSERPVLPRVEGPLLHPECLRSDRGASTPPAQNGGRLRSA